MLIFISCRNNEPLPAAGTLQLSSIQIGSSILDLSSGATNQDIPVDQPIQVTFTSGLDTPTIAHSVILRENNDTIAFGLTFSADSKSFLIHPEQVLQHNNPYSLEISDKLKGANRETFAGVTVPFTTVAGTLTISSLTIDGNQALNSQQLSGISKDIHIEITFSDPVDRQTVSPGTISLNDKIGNLPLTFTFSDQDKTVGITSSKKLRNLTRNSLVITDLVKGADGENFRYFERDFYSTYDSIPVMPVISDDELLTLIQQQTFKYFWDFGHPVSGLARERNTSGDIVTTGGSGFGIMAIVAGIDRGFITRQKGVDRLRKIVDFLGNADRFHGAWSHWMNGNTGKVIPFSTMDDGGDLVETSYMAMGLLTARQYLNASDSAENQLIKDINSLWEGIDWSWYTRGGQNVLYWHWSPDYDWAMNMPIHGYDEALITYIMASSSPTHSISADVYHQGWAENGGIVNGNTYYGYTLPLGPDYGGPLFFAHYTFLGLNPNGLSDTYANYWTQNMNHTLINRAYCIQNPKHYIGYGPQCWGLTASDNQNGYSAHSPTNDLGVITPTAAISSISYTPDQSMDAIRFFYYTLGDRLWGDYGFYDAFNLTDGWTANSYLAIDEGPIIDMIENYRTGLLWGLFMSCPEVQSGLTKLGFSVN